MAIVNKFCCLLGVVIFYCNSVFAIEVNIIEVSHPDYQKATDFIDEVDSIAITGKDAVVLKVYFDGGLEVKFSSKDNKLPGSMCPEDFFIKPKNPSDKQEGKLLFNHQAAQLLLEHHFPLEQLFNFTMILSEGASELSTNTNSMVEIRTSLQRAFEKARVPTEDSQQYLKTLSFVFTKAVNYIECAQKGMCPIYERLVSACCRGETSPLSAEPKTALENAKLKIWESYNGRTSEYIAGKKILSQISPFLLLPEIDILTEVEREKLPQLRLKLYCNYWGGEAEDALIYFVLQHIHKIEGRYVYDGRIPQIIEIYGNKDPCFQCQVKLQWLVDHLAQLFHVGTTISYYSRNAYEVPWLCANLPWETLRENKFTTRSKEDEHKIKKFMFVAGASYFPELFDIDTGDPFGIH